MKLNLIEKLVNKLKIPGIELDISEAVDVYYILKSELNIALSIHKKVKRKRRNRRLNDQEKQTLGVKYERYKSHLFNLKRSGLNQNRLSSFTQEWKKIRQRYQELIK